jgi:hypothetical protein
MRHQVTLALTAINLVVLLSLGGSLWTANADTTPTVLRGSALEIVDAMGNVRASIGILPGGTDASGKPFAETVLLRLIDGAGQPSVKISTTGMASGLSFVGGDDASYVLLQADGPETALRMVEPGGETAIAP